MRQRILDAARDILLSEGFRGLPLGLRQRVRVGTIYNYFADFDDVVLHLNAETISRLDEVLRAACAEPPRPHPAALVLLISIFFMQTMPPGAPCSSITSTPATRCLSWYRGVIVMTVAHVVEAFGPFAAGYGQANRAELIVGLWAGLHGLASLDREGEAGDGCDRRFGSRHRAPARQDSALRGACWRG